MKIRAKRVLIVIMSLACIAAAVILYVVVTQKTEETAQSQMLQTEMERRMGIILDRQDFLNMTEVTPFIWNEEYSVLGYVTEENLITFMGEKGNSMNMSNDKSRVLGDDLGYWIMFFDEDHLILNAEGYEWNIDGQPLQKNIAANAWLQLIRSDNNHLIYMVIEE